MPSQKIRPIVKAAFKVDELVYQFTQIDVEDGYLDSGAIAEVNLKYDDAHLIEEARNRLDIALDDDNQDDASWQRDAAQLRRFVQKWA